MNQDRTKGCDKDERVVFQVIERAGNKGIWVRDIRSFSGLVLPQLNKVLKNLESKPYFVCFILVKIKQRAYTFVLSNCFINGV